MHMHTWCIYLFDPQNSVTADRLSSVQGPDTMLEAASPARVV